MIKDTLIFINKWTWLILLPILYGFGSSNSIRSTNFDEYEHHKIDTCISTINLLDSFHFKKPKIIVGCGEFTYNLIDDHISEIIRIYSSKDIISSKNINSKNKINYLEVYMNDNRKNKVDLALKTNRGVYIGMPMNSFEKVANNLKYSRIEKVGRFHIFEFESDLVLKYDTTFMVWGVDCYQAENMYTGTFARYSKNGPPNYIARYIFENKILVKFGFGYSYDSKHPTHEFEGILKLD